MKGTEYISVVGKNIWLPTRGTTSRCELPCGDRIIKILPKFYWKRFKQKMEIMTPTSDGAMEQQHMPFKSKAKY